MHIQTLTIFFSCCRILMVCLLTLLCLFPNIVFILNIQHVKNAICIYQWMNVKGNRMISLTINSAEESYYLGFTSLSDFETWQMFIEVPQCRVLGVC